MDVTCSEVPKENIAERKAESEVLKVVQWRLRAVHEVAFTERILWDGGRPDCFEKVVRSNNKTFQNSRL